MIDYVTVEQMPAIIHLRPAWDDAAVPILMTANDYTIAQISVILRALLHYRRMRSRYDIVIAHNNVSEQNMAVIQEMVESEADVLLRFSKVEAVRNNRYFRFDRRFVETDLLKIFCPMMLRYYPKMILLKETCIPQFDLAAVSQQYSFENCLGVMPQAPGLQFFNLELCRAELALNDFIVAVKNRKNGSVASVQQEIFHKRMQLMDAGGLRQLKAIQYWDQWPWERLDCPEGDIFWRFARKTPYYEILRLRLDLKGS